MVQLILDLLFPIFSRRYKMDDFVRDLQSRFDNMTVDQIVYLFVPEVLHLKDVYEKRGDEEKVRGCQEVLAYVKTKVELDDFKVFDEFSNPKFIVPSPSEIINKKSPSGIPNN